jgi:hypothetical protein
MKSIKVVALVLCCALCTLAFFASAPSLAADSCMCLGGPRTHTMTGSGATCTAADQNLYNMVIASANLSCSGDPAICIGALNITTACQQVGGTWQESGYLTFKCEVCV